MRDSCRLFGRLFYFLLIGVLAVGTMYAATPGTTIISDVVYRADGTPAGGTLLVSWPAFTTSEGAAVGAGTESVALGAGGSLSVALVPNAGAIPASTYYTVVYQLNDGTVKTEYWVVPTNSPTTIAAVRATLGSTGSTSQMATQQYVNAAVANMATNSSVVHLTGSETIVGLKDFAASPSVPNPIQPTDAVNKEYVDGLVSNVGAGSYVSKAGDTMTGPLMLSGDPTAPNHAADKHYVDSGLSAKADLILGIVPPSQMGNGTHNNTTCLKGDSSWGACGTSSNAISIQNVPVDTIAPTDNQVITYDAVSGKYKPKAGGGVTAGMQAIKYAIDFSWSQNPSTDLTVAGLKTVNLPACPAGVKASEPEYWVYVSGAGTAEAVKVSGGTCNGDGLPGTLQFTTAYSHSAGYAISSASGGLQEALIGARISPTNPTGPPQAGYVVVPPGEFRAYARVSVRASDMTVDFSGSIVECYMADTCIYVGDYASSNTYQDISLIGPRGRPMVVGGQKPFIEVNAQKTRLFNVATRIAATGAYFSSFVQVDDDQAFLLDGLDTTLGGSSGNYGVRCDASVCNPVIYAPGPFNVNSAVGWLKNLNISMQCRGNGIDWQSGNTLKVTDSVIQGYSQYGVRGGTRRGGYGGLELDNVYEEVGTCANPAGNVGIAGLVAQGSTVKITGGEAPGGVVPQFANTGTTDYRYYVIARHASYGVSNPLYAGKALTNMSGNITVAIPDIAGAASFDILRVTAPANAREQAPYGTGNYAVVTNVARTSACGNGICTFTDTQAALGPYTVAPPTYFPMLDYWPGALILGSNQDSNTWTTSASAKLDNAGSSIVSVRGMVGPSVFATACDAQSLWTPLWTNCAGQTSPPGDLYEQGALVVAAKPNTDGGLKTNLKGRLNFSTLGTAPGHIITLSDSNFQKTIATANNRPANDGNDAFVGYDQGDGDPANIGVSFGSPKSLSNYIGNVGDGTNWKERLTASLKEFKTDVKIDGNLTIAGTCTGCGGGGGSITLKTNGVNNGSQSLLNLKSGSNITLTDDGVGGVTIAASGSGGGVSSVFGRTGSVTAQAGDYSEAQITGLTADMAAKLGNAGPQTFSGDLTVTGKVIANTFQSTATGPWSVQGAFGSLTAAPANNSMLGFGANGKLSVSENGGAVTEVAKKLSQQFTYTFFDANNQLTTALQVPSIYVNRAAAFHITEVYCELDAGTGTINLQNAGTNVLSSDLVCTTGGATSSSFVSGKDAVGVNQKIGHVTVATGTGLHRMSVVVKYTVD